MNRFTAAVLQMVSGPEMDINLDAVQQGIAEARREGCQLLVLPENFYLMARGERRRLEISENFGAGPLQDFLARQARQNDMFLVAGTLPLTSPVPERIHSSCLVYDPEGQCIGRYDKRYLFDATVDAQSGEQYRESATFTPGRDSVVLHTSLANMGLSVCYDVRFPEHYRDMLEHKVQIIIVVAAFTAHTGAAHWESLLRARAIENQCYLLAANQGGQHYEGRNTWGHSMIIDPWGRILAQCTDGPGLARADIDLESQARLRLDFPCLAHRK